MVQYWFVKDSSAIMYLYVWDEGLTIVFLSLYDALTAVLRLNWRRWNRFQFWFWLPSLAQSSISPIFLIEAFTKEHIEPMSQWEALHNHWQPIRGHRHPYSDWDASIQINGSAAVAKTLAEVQSGIISSSPLQRCCEQWAITILM